MTDKVQGRVKPGDLITVFGGSGFIGRHLVQELARRGYRVRVAVRNPNKALFLRPMGDVGQVVPVFANVRDRASVAAALEGARGVINLVGILAEGGKQRFEALQAEAPGLIAEEATKAGAQRFVQMSAIGADADSPSDYARTKAEGEVAASTGFPGAIIVRPSIVFGPEDDFFNRFAGMAALSPVLPLIGGGTTRFQPVYVKDVVAGTVTVLESPESPGKVYEFGGPEIYTFKELLDLVREVTSRKGFYVPVPFFAAGFGAFFAQFVPGAPLTPDQVKLLREDNVVADVAEGEGRTLRGLGIKATAAEAILPSYLYRFRNSGQFAKRSAA